jgi:ankyrin repeat protein
MVYSVSLSIFSEPLMSQRNPTLRALLLFVLVFGGGAAVYAAWALGTYSDSRTATAAAAVPVAGDVNLHALAEQGNVEALQRALIAPGADANLRLTGTGPDRGITPLMVACRAGQFPAVNALIAARANVNLSMEDGRTALILAAIQGDEATISALLEAGANVNARDESGFTALMFAAVRGTPAAVSAIAGRGADIEARNRWRETALMLAARAGDAAKLEALLNAGAAVDAVNQDGKSVLNLACESGASVELVAVLIRKGANVNAADIEGVTPLMWAAQRGDLEVAKTLLAAGADKTIKSRAGFDAATYAENRGDELGQAVAKLLK